MCCAFMVMRVLHLLHDEESYPVLQLHASLIEVQPIGTAISSTKLTACIFMPILYQCTLTGLTWIPGMALVSLSPVVAHVVCHWCGYGM